MAKLLVRDLMTAKVEVLQPDSTVAEMLDLLREREIRHVPVVDGDGELVGLVTHRDLLRGTLSDAQVDLPPDLTERLQESRSVDTIMTTDVITTEAEMPISEAASMMLENKLGCLPVTEGLRLVGILTESDFTSWVAENS